MTTKVTVETYGYPVLVEKLDNQANNPVGKWTVQGTVQPNEKQDFTLCSGYQFKITELPAFVKESQKSS